MEVFRTNFARLQQSITAPVALAGYLYSKQLIGQGVHNFVITSSVDDNVKAAWLLRNVEVTLNESVQPTYFLKTLCDVLDETREPALQIIAAEMRSSIEGRDVNYITF